VTITVVDVKAAENHRVRQVAGPDAHRDGDGLAVGELV